MTTKQALHAYVDVLDEAEASALLSEARLMLTRRDDSKRLSLADLARMPVAEREALMKDMYFEVDLDELAEWEAGTGADGLDDDE